MSVETGKIQMLYKYPQTGTVQTSKMCRVIYQEEVCFPEYGRKAQEATGSHEQTQAGETTQS